MPDNPIIREKRAYLWDIASFTQLIVVKDKVLKFFVIAEGGKEEFRAL